MTAELSRPPIRFNLPDLPGPVAALRMAMTQAEARQNAHNFIANMLRVLDTADVARETRDKMHDLAEHMLLDEALDEPYAIFAAAHSCLSPELIWPDGRDRGMIDEIYGDGFAAALCASVPDGYPRPAGTVRGDGGMPAKYTEPCGEWTDALSVGAFPAGQSRCVRPRGAGGCGESR